MSRLNDFAVAAFTWRYMGKCIKTPPAASFCLWVSEWLILGFWETLAAGAKPSRAELPREKSRSSTNGHLSLEGPKGAAAAPPQRCRNAAAKELRWAPAVGSGVSLIKTGVAYRWCEGRRPGRDGATACCGLGQQIPHRLSRLFRGSTLSV